MKFPYFGTYRFSGDIKALLLLRFNIKNSMLTYTRTYRCICTNNHTIKYQSSCRFDLFRLFDLYRYIETEKYKVMLTQYSTRFEKIISFTLYAAGIAFFIAPAP